MKALLVLLALAACSPAPATREIPVRDPSHPIASKADLELDRLTGPWREVARLPGGGACPGAVVDIARNGDRLIMARTCAGGRPVPRQVAVTGPGRLTDVASGRAEWILWIDADYRTAILADPHGTGARVLDRDGAPPPDRRQAVGVVLDFNGYPTDRLVWTE